VTDAASFRLQASAPNVQQGGTVSVDLYVDAGPLVLDGFTMYVDFSPLGILDVTDTGPTPPQGCATGINIVPGTVGENDLGDGETVVNCANNQNGWIDLGMQDSTATAQASRSTSASGSTSSSRAGGASAAGATSVSSLSPITSSRSGQRINVAGGLTGTVKVGTVNFLARNPACGIVVVNFHQAIPLNPQRGNTFSAVNDNVNGNRVPNLGPGAQIAINGVCTATPTATVPTATATSTSTVVASPTASLVPTLTAIPSPTLPTGARRSITQPDPQPAVSSSSNQTTQNVASESVAPPPAPVQSGVLGELEVAARPPAVVPDPAPPVEPVLEIPPVVEGAPLGLEEVRAPVAVQPPPQPAPQQAPLPTVGPTPAAVVGRLPRTGGPVPGPDLLVLGLSLMALGLGVRRFRP
jgi:hypothetical protein